MDVENTIMSELRRYMNDRGDWQSWRALRPRLVWCWSRKRASLRGRPLTGWPSPRRVTVKMEKQLNFISDSIQYSIMGALLSCNNYAVLHMKGLEAIPRGVSQARLEAWEADLSESDIGVK